jgi:hypothetical protein
LLQRLFEELTSTEGGPLWMGKPASVLVTAHQVGAQAVLWRLQGMATALGCLVPPMSGVVITKVAEHLRQRAPELCADVWGWEDVATALHNLLAAPRLTIGYSAWPVDHEHFSDRWLDAVTPAPPAAHEVFTGDPAAPPSLLSVPPVDPGFSQMADLVETAPALLPVGSQLGADPASIVPPAS